MDPAGALVEEATRRSSLIWVRREGAAGPARAMWHVWVDGRAYVVAGGGEQPLPDGLLDEPVARAEVTVASKDKRSRLVAWLAEIAVVVPGGEEWEGATRALAAKRLNAPDGDAAPRRWAQDSTVVRLAPTGEVTETPDRPSTVSHAAPPG